MARFALAGSGREKLPGATIVGAAPHDEPVLVSVMLRPGPHRHATHADMEAVEVFAAAHELTVSQRDAARRTIVLTGTAAACDAAFGVTLHCYTVDDLQYRGREGHIHLPVALEGAVVAVLGLDNRPSARPQFRPAATNAGGFTPPQIAQLYDLPPGDGAGHCIGIVELGGGFVPADIAAYFAAIGVPAPTVVAIGVDGATNAPTGDPGSADGEVLLDIEVAGGIAPAATIAVYFAPNTDSGFLDAITTAIHDPVNRPTVISISWGGPEDGFTQQATTAFDQAFQDAAAMGIVVCVACGDNGSTDGRTDGADHVDFPASSPNVLACGGTSVQVSNGALASETVWNNGPGRGATGGGVSKIFPVPSYQRGLSAIGTAPLAGRGVPDVSGDADPRTGYAVRVDGTDIVVGGTSAVSPLWAGLIVRALPAGAKAGFLNPKLYATPAALRDVTSGNNGTFSARRGWDACTGLGTPNGAVLAPLIAGPAPVTS